MERTHLTDRIIECMILFFCKSICKNNLSKPFTLTRMFIDRMHSSVLKRKEWKGKRVKERKGKERKERNGEERR